MDFQDWELLADSCFDINQNLNKRIIPHDKRSSDSKNSLDSEYILCSSPNTRKIKRPDQVVDPVPVPLKSKIVKAVEVTAVKEISKNPDEVKADQHVAPHPKVSCETKENASVDNTTESKIVNVMEVPAVRVITKNSDEVKADQCVPPLPKVSVETKENVSVDKTTNPVNKVPAPAVRVIPKNTDEVKADQCVAPLPKVSLETKENVSVDKTTNPVNRDASKWEGEREDRDKEENENKGFNLWKWSFTGLGAICTFGVTAATICVLLLGTQEKNKRHSNEKNVCKLYTDDKRIKRVMEQATKWNEAISSSVARAHIAYGPYPDGLFSVD